LAFRLSIDDYTATAQYPSTQILADATDSNGDGSIDLWQNADGLATSPASHYICTLPTGEEFSFIVLTGDTDVELGDLRLVGI